MHNISYSLYKHISEKYSSVPSFAELSGISHKELAAVLLKENTVREIMLGLRICGFLGVDVKRHLPGSEQFGDDFRKRFVRLSESEKEKVLEFMVSQLG